MVHRIQSRNTGYNDTNQNTLVLNQQAALNATEGATALDINISNEQNQIKQNEEKNENENLFENVSIESAAYLQNVENNTSNNESTNDEDTTSFEVDSIELKTPELFSENLEGNSTNLQEEKKEDSIDVESQDTNELEMFDNKDFEDDFEIPAFLRKQKN